MLKDAQLSFEENFCFWIIIGVIEFIATSPQLDA
jgi:hypothetical protein